MPFYLCQYALYPLLSTFHAKNNSRIILQILTIERIPGAQSSMAAIPEPGPITMKSCVWFGDRERVGQSKFQPKRPVMFRDISKECVFPIENNVKRWNVKIRRKRPFCLCQHRFLRFLSTSHAKNENRKYSAFGPDFAPLNPVLKFTWESMGGSRHIRGPPYDKKIEKNRTLFFAWNVF